MSGGFSWNQRNTGDHRGCIKKCADISERRIPLLASQQGGVAERSINDATPTLKRGRGGFPIENRRKTTPAASASVASRHLINDAATPPCCDARRGIRPDSDFFHSPMDRPYSR